MKIAGMKCLVAEHTEKNKLDYVQSFFDTLDDLARCKVGFDDVAVDTPEGV